MKKNVISRFFSDFKAFIAKGRIIDLAIGVVIGGAFSKIVTSLVNDIIMPPISLALSGHTVSELQIILKEATLDNAAVTINIGIFLQNIIDFFLIAICIFTVLRILISTNKMIDQTSQLILTPAQIEECKKHAKINKLSRKDTMKYLHEVDAIERKKKEEEDKKKPTVESLLGEIRDLLKK